MRTIVFLAALFCLAPHTHAALVGGLEVTELAPPEVATSTSLSIATDSTGQLWYSNGTHLLTAAGDGSPAVVEALRQNAGGPLGNNTLTSAIAFDAQDRMYINDIVAGQILRRDSPAGSWSVIASGFQTIRAMELDPISGDMIIATDAFSLSSPSKLLRMNGLGEVSTIASNLPPIESFTFDGAGNIVFANLLTGELYQTTLAGETSLIGQGTAGFGHVESIAISDVGLIFLGVNTGASGGNHNRLDRYDPFLDEAIVLGIDFTGIGGVGFRLPLDMQFAADGSLLIAAFGSVLPVSVTGNANGDFGTGLAFGTAPEPATMLSIGIAFIILSSQRRRRTSAAPTRGI